ncbi:HNH endonuclease [Oceanicaulis sp.]|uniref:HNH endonuclease n=1 Tax=Oceanicaulis sp. TaxID=1924941 RepID=UPI003D2883AA
MSRRPEWIPDRTAIPNRVKIEVFARSDGQCQQEGCDRVGKEYDHIKPQALGGDNSAGNVQLLCRKCHKAKTRGDAATVTKADRQGGRIGQYARREKAKAAGKHKGIQSGGFQNGRNGPFKTPLGGKTVRREGV